MQTIRAIANLSEGLPTDPVAVANAPTAVPWPMSARAGRVAIDVARSIPTVGRALSHIAGTTSTFNLIAWTAAGDAIRPTDRRVRWLQKPDTVELLPWTLARTMEDLVWHDRSVWRIRDRYIDDSIVNADRIHPNRVDTLANPHDPERVDKWIIDGTEVSRSHLIVIDGAGMGGMRRYGFELLELYGQLQAAAGRYAVAPHPHAILKNSGADLTDEEITALLDDWEAARSTRAVGYLNDVIDYETHGWNAEELQLTEAREHAALEVARLFRLPARAVDAKTGDSMTYANAVEARRDIAAALKPWQKPLIAALSHASGVNVALDDDDYTRDDPKTRMETWQIAKETGALTPEEIRALEPLAARRLP